MQALLECYLYLYHIRRIKEMAVMGEFVTGRQTKESRRGILARAVRKSVFYPLTRRLYTYQNCSVSLYRSYSRSPFCEEPVLDLCYRRGLSFRDARCFSPPSSGHMETVFLPEKAIRLHRSRPEKHKSPPGGTRSRLVVSLATRRQPGGNPGESRSG